VRAVGWADVYSLTVADDPEFFANGVLVHNCDALIYARTKCLHYHAQPAATPPPPRGSPEARQARLDRDEEEAALLHEDEGSDLAGFTAGEDWA
jgi:hypothetical protein